MLRLGVRASTFDGRSASARYIRDLEAALIAHVGGNPPITVRLLIERAIRTTLQLHKLDEKFETGET